MNLDDIVTGVDGVDLRTGNPEIVVGDICHDSRAVEEGTLFVALRGDHFDGHQFVDAAVEAGASALLVDRGAQFDVSVPILEADDTRRVLGMLASHFYEYPSRQLTVIGITGTNGKTSSSYLMESVFRKSGRATGLIGTIEYRWPGRQITAKNTTPDGLVLQRTLRAMVDDGVEVAILEVSSHGLELGRVDGIEFDIALFTNLTRDHLDFHGSMDAYRAAKWRLFQDRSPRAVINTDGAEGRKLARAIVDDPGVRLATHATTSSGGVHGCDHHFSAQQLEVALDGVSMVVEESRTDAEYEIFAPLPGRFNAENVLGVLAVARLAGVSVDAVAAGLAESDGIPGRLQRVDFDAAGPAVFVDYAHTPDALAQSLETLRPLARGQLWVVFGCGGDRDRTKRAPMGEVASERADRIIVTSDNPRSEDPHQIIDEIVGGLAVSDDGEEQWSRQSDRREAIFDAILRAATQDVILIAGKGHETYQEIGAERHAFDDRDVALDALRSRGGR